MPAPQPVVIDYSSASIAGLLAQRAGMGQDFWRRHHAGQQQVESQRAHNLNNRQLELQAQAQNQAYALQSAYSNVPQSQGVSAPGVAPESIRVQQARDLIGNMLKRGTINEDIADRLNLGVTTGSPSLASLGIDGDRGANTANRADVNQNVRFMVGSLESQRKAAMDQAKAFLEMIPGGLRAMTVDQQQQYQGYINEAESLRQEIAKVYKEGATRTGAVGAPPPSPHTTPGTGDDLDPLGLRSPAPAAAPAPAPAAAPKKPQPREPMGPGNLHQFMIY